MKSKKDRVILKRISALHKKKMWVIKKESEMKSKNILLAAVCVLGIGTYQVAETAEATAIHTKNTVYTEVQANEYATINKNAAIYDESLQKIDETKNGFLDQTYQIVPGKNIKVKNVTYYLLMDNQKQAIGYVANTAFDLSKTPGGKYRSYGKHVVVQSKTETIYANFYGKKKEDSAKYYRLPLLAKGYYQAFDGKRYLSLYDASNHWIGYLAEEATVLANNQSGPYQKYGKYVTLKASNALLYKNFAWDKKASASSYVGQTLLAKGYYKNFNGKTYFSLYNNQNKWLGYLEQAATTVAKNELGNYTKQVQKVEISKENYEIYEDVITKEVVDYSSTYLNKTANSKGYYYAFNGIKYVDLYDVNDDFIGFIQSEALADKLTVKKQYLFVMGHGGYDPGAVGNGTSEREFTRNELLPKLRKYAAKLKNSQIIFYDPSRNMYSDTIKGLGARTVAQKTASITEIHLDSAGPTATGGHVIVPRSKGATVPNYALAQTIKKNNGMWAGVTATNGLSFRSDLLNLNVFSSRNMEYRLTELGFISNANDLKRIRKKLDAIAKSMIEDATGEKIK